MCRTTKYENYINTDDSYLVIQSEGNYFQDDDDEFEQGFPQLKGSDYGAFLTFVTQRDLEAVAEAL